MAKHSALYVSHIKSFAWRITRELSLKNADYRCCKCNDIAMHVHHKHYRTLGREELP